MGLRAGLDRCGKSRPPPGFDPRTVQPVGSRYTDYATRLARKFVIQREINRLVTLQNRELIRTVAVQEIVTTKRWKR